jgi:hypothetical protein
MKKRAGENNIHVATRKAGRICKTVQPHAAGTSSGPGLGRCKPKFRRLLIGQRPINFLQYSSQLTTEHFRTLAKTAIDVVFFELSVSFLLLTYLELKLTNTMGLRPS